MKEDTPFVTHLSSFKGNEDVLLLLVDHPTIRWLISQLGEFVGTGSIGARHPTFVIGDGNPVESGGKCIIIVEPNRQANVSELLQESGNTFRWRVSPSSAYRYQELLSGMLKSRAACHQYLDPDNVPAAVVIVSLGEYDADVFRSRAV